jgi:hypothetical protein
LQRQPCGLLLNMLCRRHCRTPERKNPAMHPVSVPGSSQALYPMALARGDTRQRGQGRAFTPGASRPEASWNLGLPCQPEHDATQEPEWPPCPGSETWLVIADMTPP